MLQYPQQARVCKTRNEANPNPVPPECSRPARDWKRRFIYRKESLKTTWLLRIMIAAGSLLVLWLWFAGAGQQLVCREQVTAADALLIDNFDPDYLLFERAAELRRAGMASRVFVADPGIARSAATRPCGSGFRRCHGARGQAAEPGTDPCKFC